MSAGAHYSTIGSIGVITFDRQNVRNAIDSQTAHLVAEMAGQAENDASVGALIITGTGNQAFCSGMDLKEAATMGAAAIGPGHVVIPGQGLAGLTERRFTKPVIAAVNGAAVGGGCEIALACDIIIAQEKALFALPEVRRGLFAFAGGIQRIAKLIPRSEAMSFILSGNPISAQRMFELGVVSQLVPEGRALDVALSFAEALLANSWTAMRSAKSLFELSLDLPLNQSMLIGNEIGFACFAHADAAEGISAYSDGRDASF